MIVDKEHILNEIKRTAGANSGKLLGEQAFYRATGLRRADWHGKFWARFSEAVKEAGFIPREFPDEKQYTDDWILEKYAALSKKLGKLAANGDLKLSKRGDPNLPNYKVYEMRFGSKISLVDRLSTYCAALPEYKNVLQWCQNYIKDNQQPPANNPDAEKKVGYVYLIKMGKFCKIGGTTDFMRRGSEITTKLPEKASIVHFFQTDDIWGIESYWHRRFSEKRREGEWFELEAKDILAFKKRRAFM